MPDFEHLVGKELARGSWSWDADRAMLYAIGIGAGLEDPYEDLQFTTDNTLNVEQQVIPSFLTQMHAGGDWIRQLGFKARQWDGMDWGYPEGLVHGEQSVTLARPIPVSGTVDISQVLIGVYDKGSGALAVAENRVTLADTGEPLGSSRMGLFVRNQGGFGGPRGPSDEAAWVEPEGEPGVTVTQMIQPGQSLIFRLLGDKNPHGTDPARAEGDGFHKPIFFGLGTYGFGCRALLKGLCDNDVARFGSIYGRFSKPVHPGEKLETHIWRTDGGAQFRTIANGERVAIDRGVFRYAGM